MTMNSSTVFACLKPVWALGHGFLNSALLTLVQATASQKAGFHNMTADGCQDVPERE
jgi:hypothetical protein